MLALNVLHILLPAMLSDALERLLEVTEYKKLNSAYTTAWSIAICLLAYSLPYLYSASENESSSSLWVIRLLMLMSMLFTT